MNNIINLVNRPTGKPQLSDFKFTEEPQPKIEDGEILLQSKYISVDPYLRGRMNDEESYIPPFDLNAPMESTVVAEVIDSKNL